MSGRLSASLTVRLSDRLTRRLTRLTKPIEPPLTPLATYLPFWLADCWSEVRNQLNCPSGPVQVVLTREFRRENPSSTARRQVQLVYAQRGSQLKLKFSWSWESSTVVENAQISWSSAQLKSSTVVEKAQLSWSLVQLKSSTVVEQVQLLFNRNTPGFSNLTTVNHRMLKRFWFSKLAFEYRGLSFGKQQPSFWIPLYSTTIPILKLNKI
jgi:hypothetical protein